MRSKVFGALASAAVLSFVFTGTASAVSGTASYYNDAGYGACGTQINAATEMLVAAPAALWTSPNPNNDPLCRKSIRVTHNGRTITVPIKDKCPSCPSNKIDLSQPAFASLANTSLGIISVTWEIV
ncbi:cysteine/serine endopeptidase inhibitor [Lentzea sp. DG1S-22]|uniref:cysteine/serine endopeptidase inhibitor n=1 Tax=Lentzea sp. DG1S-22 TaxID=3108822 RepID=UPI002E75E3B3|nr:cysteine/serine endopeptidase inhibitor [Lentzea sp. DG1S-22]WVH81339.1 cysteine/serine endopeptidase inhibitor [Lentzea sp. DG1S-22]